MNGKELMASLAELTDEELLLPVVSVGRSDHENYEVNELTAGETMWYQDAFRTGLQGKVIRL